ncbi:hypothetical protein [Pleurocapsa sp. PCC 7319]|uniref:hypothetical protein n=1 Tax=Pleurocapsa sp. PCC 7319 TaxID=118161 RepID=UPI00037C239F|nr:hypothetical protein [Pleurocapsa sp. PCC 7319]
MPIHGQYSRDLYSCYLTFSKIFPAYADDMFLIFTRYIKRCDDIDKLLQAIDAVDDFLIKKINNQ